MSERPCDRVARAALAAGIFKTTKTHFQYHRRNARGELVATGRLFSRATVNRLVAAKHARRLRGLIFPR